MTAAANTVRRTPQATVGKVDRATFRDPALQAEFERTGFAILPFLTPDQVQVARQFFSGLDDPAGQGFQTDFQHPDAVRKQTIHDAMSQMAAPVMADLLDRYRPFMSTFLAKWPGEGSGLYVHQDWSYVDEQRHRSVVIWVALEDIGPDHANGPLAVLPGSHRVAGEHRGTSTGAWYTERADDVAASLIPVSVTAGDAIILDNAVVHASPDNTTADLRLAMAFACIPEEAQLHHAVGRPDGRVDLLDVDDRFFREVTPSSLVERVPEPWAKTARTVAARWRAPDLPLASRLCGIDLVAPPTSPLGGSAPPDMGASLTGRLAGAILARNHGAITAHSDADMAGPFLPNEAFRWIAPLEAAWTDIRAEYADAHGKGAYLAPLPLLAGAELPNVGRWDALLLRDNRGWTPGAKERCPITVGLLQAVPGIRAAMFSTLGPWARIEPHRGPNKGVLRAHLGVIVPEAPGRAGLWAGAEHRDWSPGRAFVFDDTFEHRVANQSDEWRVSLMIEFDRPLTGVDRVVNRAVQRAFRWHPQLRGAKARQRQVQAALDA